MVLESDPSLKTKEEYIALANTKLTDLARLSPHYPTLQLARGVLSLLKAALPAQSRTGLGGLEHAERERLDSLRIALNCFDTTLRSNSRNIMALTGKARVLFSQGQFGEALRIYQDILQNAPQLRNPDPRIGIGACFWRLGHRDDAKMAWERALEVNPESQHANILLGVYHLQNSSQYPTSDPRFVESYKKGMSFYTQKAFKLDDKMPLACSTFGGLFQVRQAWDSVEKLAQKAISYTDVNAIASDGWYLLARKAHQAGDYPKAQECYVKSDQARGGDDKGYLPAKFGAAQIQILLGDTEAAKFRLEKLNQQAKTVEAQTLLGTLYAESVFKASPTQANKEEILNQRKKAITLFEQVRTTWKDAQKKFTPDTAVLLSLARLYERESPERSLQCLKQVEEMEMAALPDDAVPIDIEDAAERHQLLREMLPPPLLNNMGCFYYSMDKFGEARELFQTALNACVKARDLDSELDIDASVTTISFNLGRTYEAEGSLDEAQDVYNGLVDRHTNYGDALARLAFIAYQKNVDSGSQELRELYDRDPANMDVRAMYGWFLNRTKKRSLNTNDDPEQKNGKQSLVQYDKHDQYTLTSMGNIWLTVARELRSESEKDRRHRCYERAAEFFNVALQHDPLNAYAAQGVAIAIAEDKKDLSAALSIFSTVRETMKDATVYLNLGHVFCELKQFTRAIENYEIALAKKDRVSEITVLTALGRVWYYKGRTEKNLEAFKNSLSYSIRVSTLSPDQPHFLFNVAFVQFNIAQLICSLPTAQRTLEDVQTASVDLESAIDALIALSKHQTPPYPRNDLESRAKMGRTMARQLDRALADQTAHSEQNTARLEAARAAREAEIQRKEDRKRKEAEAVEQQRRKILEERAKIVERDRLLAEQRAEEDKRREEDALTTDSQTGERRRRVKKVRVKGEGGSSRRRKGRESSIVSDGHLSDGEGSGSNTEGGTTQKVSKSKKKRRLVRESKRSSKFKSSEMIEDSDEEIAGFANVGDAGSPGDASSEAVATPAGVEDDGGDDEDGGSAVQRSAKKRGRQVVVDEDESDDE